MNMILTAYEIQKLYELIEQTDDEEKKAEYQAMIDRSYDLEMDYRD